MDDYWLWRKVLRVPLPILIIERWPEHQWNCYRWRSGITFSFGPWAAWIGYATKLEQEDP